MLFHPTHITFLYVVMQGLPPTLLEFQNRSNAVRTLSDILYGRRKYVLCINTVMPSLCINLRIIQQTLTEEVCATPLLLATLSIFLQLNNNTFSEKLTVYYSMLYGRVKKRNCFTVLYNDHTNKLLLLNIFHT